MVEDITIFPEGSWGTNSASVSSSDRLVLREKWKLWQLPPLVRRNMRRSLTSWSKSKSLAPSLSPSTSRMWSPFKLKPYQTPTRAPRMKTDKPSGTRSSSNISLNPLCLERGGFSGRFLCSCSAECFTPRQYRRGEGRSRQVWSSTPSGCNSESWETACKPVAVGALLSLTPLPDQVWGRSNSPTATCILWRFWFSEITAPSAPPREEEKNKSSWKPAVAERNEERWQPITWQAWNPFPPPLLPPKLDGCPAAAAGLSVATCLTAL